MATPMYLKLSAAPLVPLWGDGAAASLFSTMRDSGRGIVPLGAANWYGSPAPSTNYLDSTIGTGAGGNTSATTVAGPTAGLIIGAAANPRSWWSAPLAADVTISGTITFNICGNESSMNANAGWRVIVYRVDEQGTLASVIADSQHGTEMSVTTTARHTWTVTPTSTNMKKGDRILVFVLVDDVGTMGSGFTCFLQYGGANASTADSNVTFTETLTFITSEPSGTKFWLRDTASDLAIGAAIEKLLGLTQGSGTVTAVHTTIAGPLAFPGDQWTATAGGSDVEWYTNPLDAFTLGGVVKVEVGEDTAATIESSGLSPTDSLVCELAIVDADGSNPVIWARSYDTGTTTSGDLHVRHLTGPDLAVGQGKRLRFRVFSDDLIMAATITSQAAGTNRTFRYDGTTTYAAALTFTQTITEAGTPVSNTATLACESLLGVVAGGARPLESLGLITSSRIPAVESRGNIVSARTAAAEWRLGLVTLAQLDIESLGRSAAALPAAWESAGPVASARSPALESLVGVSSTRTVDLEQLIAVVRALTPDLEWLQGLSRALPVPWESLQPVLIVGLGVAALEQLGLVTRARSADLESLLQILRAADVPWESRSLTPPVLFDVVELVRLRIRSPWIAGLRIVAPEITGLRIRSGRMADALVGPL